MQQGWAAARAPLAVRDGRVHSWDVSTGVWVPYVLVPGWTDAPAEIAAVADGCASLPNVECVDVLAFHTLGRAKYERLGIPFALAGTPVRTSDQVAAARAVFAARGLAVS